MRSGAGDDVKLMVDFNQGLTLGDAIHRCHALDDQGLYWFEEPTTYNNLEGYALLARDLKTPLQLGENFYGRAQLYRALRSWAPAIRDARPEVDRVARRPHGRLARGPDHRLARGAAVWRWAAPRGDTLGDATSASPPTARPCSPS